MRNAKHTTGPCAQWIEQRTAEILDCEYCRYRMFSHQAFERIGGHWLKWRANRGTCSTYERCVFIDRFRICMSSSKRCRSGVIGHSSVKGLAQSRRSLGSVAAVTKIRRWEAMGEPGRASYPQTVAEAVIAIRPIRVTVGPHRP
jgi:hypothetical protein